MIFFNDMKTPRDGAQTLKELSVVLKAFVSLNPFKSVRQGQPTNSRSETGRKSRSYSITALLGQIMSTSSGGAAIKQSCCEFAIYYLQTL